MLPYVYAYSYSCLLLQVIYIRSLLLDFFLNLLAAAQNVVASPKRKCTDHNQASRLSRKSELQLFPTHPEPQEFVHVSPASKMKSSAQNLQSFTRALESDHYKPSIAIVFCLIMPKHRGKQKILWNRLSNIRCVYVCPCLCLCFLLYINCCNNLLMQAEEGDAIIFAKKDLEMAHMQDLITDLKEKVASVSTEVNHLHEVIKNKDAELANLKRKNV